MKTINKMMVLILFLAVSCGTVSAQGYGGGNGKGTRGGQDVNIQDQHTRALDLKFARGVGTPTTLALDTVVDENTITVADATGFVAGAYVGIVDVLDRFYFGTQIGAPAGNVITLDSPLDKVYSAGVVVVNLSTDLTVDGSVTPVVFQIGSATSTLEFDITRILGHMSDDASMDDSKFGSLPALTNGCVLRMSNGENTNIWNVKTNGDIALLGFDFMYPTRVPAGVFAARYRISYGGQEKHGVTLRVEAGWSVQFIIQDDLTDLSVYTQMAQGHVVE